ncbi:hypothetical protein [uncultured Pluralibacter sp.]|jgi:hypothetical protein|uniref:hypothetical protein n=1 Tax=uncultured Pluralibacter sp. TaxID=1490864 RepID=UPI00261C846D|nr:hypothetical protein [uncultured Pluralibacter sp.]
MKEGYYWVVRGNEEPEVWFFHEGTPCGWFAPTRDTPVEHQRFLEMGYTVISNPLNL